MYILTYKIVYHKRRYQCAITEEMKAVPFNCGPDFKGCSTLIIALPKCYSKVGVYQRSSGMLTYSDRGSRKLSPVSGLAQSLSLLERGKQAGKSTVSGNSQSHFGNST